METMHNAVYDAYKGNNIFFIYAMKLYWTEVLGIYTVNPNHCIHTLGQT